MSDNSIVVIRLGTIAELLDRAHEGEIPDELLLELLGESRVIRKDEDTDAG